MNVNGLCCRGMNNNNNMNLENCKLKKKLFLYSNVYLTNIRTLNLCETKYKCRR